MKIKSCSELLKIAKEQSHIVIYGAGWAGKIIAGYLKMHGIERICFGVTVQKENDVAEVDGISVREIRQLYIDNPKVYIILGALAATQRNMADYLEKNQIEKYDEITEAVIYEIRQKLLEYQARNVYYESKNEKKNKIGYLVPGYLDTNYAEQRLIIGKDSDTEYIAFSKEIAALPCVGTEYEDRIEDYKMLADAVYCPKEKVPEVDVIHTFNMVCQTEKDWMASFETMLPRLPCKTEWEKKYYVELAEAILKGNCKGIFALCKNAYDIHKTILEGRLPAEMAKKVLDKTFVLHPPQPILISEEEFYKKHTENKIHFVFLGSTFFMKGGRETIRALEYFEEKYDFKLTLISTLQTNDYFTHAKGEEKDKWQEIIRQKPWIEHYSGLPNKEALERCKEATIGLFPSFGDTYGYVLLEMQACGCPVVSTNVRAFAETNNNECGWVCELPVNEHGICNSADLESLSNILVEKLVSVFEDIFAHPNQIVKKGEAAMERIRVMHDPERYAEKIREIINNKGENNSYVKQNL